MNTENDSPDDEREFLPSDPIANKKAENDRLQKDFAYLRKTLNMPDDEITTLFPTEKERSEFTLSSRLLSSAGSSDEPDEKEDTLSADSDLDEVDVMRVGELARAEASRKKGKKAVTVSAKAEHAQKQGDAVLAERDRPSLQDYEAAINLFREIDEEDDGD